MDRKHYLVVYGTLKRGYGNHRLLRNARFVGNVVSDSHYQMHDVGFPCLTDDSNGHQFLGELFEVTPRELHLCDRLEGHPDMYCRVERTFTGMGPSIPAWVYVYQHPERFAGRLYLRVKPNVHSNLLEWGYPRAYQEGGEHAYSEAEVG